MHFHFKLEYTIRGLLLQDWNQLTFQYQRVRPISVFLRPPPQEALEKKAHRRDNAFCTASCQLEPNDRVVKHLDVLEVHEPKSVGVSLSECPDYFQSFSGLVRQELAEAAEKT